MILPTLVTLVPLPLPIQTSHYSTPRLCAWSAYDAVPPDNPYSFTSFSAVLKHHLLHEAFPNHFVLKLRAGMWLRDEAHACAGPGCRPSIDITTNIFHIFPHISWLTGKTAEPVVESPWFPLLGRPRQEYTKFKACLWYGAGSRPAGAT